MCKCYTLDDSSNWLQGDIAPKCMQFTRENIHSTQRLLCSAPLQSALDQLRVSPPPKMQPIVSIHPNDSTNNKQHARSCMMMQRRSWGVGQECAMASLVGTGHLSHRAWCPWGSRGNSPNFAMVDFYDDMLSKTKAKTNLLSQCYG